MAMPLTARRFTVDEYHRMGEAGVFHEDDRVELIDGQVVQMTPIGDRHASCVRRLNRLFARHLVELAVIDVQNPIVLGQHDAPQPDVTVLKPRDDAYRHHPGAADILLVIEVADTTADYDRLVKIPLYARAGIPEAWLVNLARDHIEVCRNPSGAGYTDIRTARRGETITPVAFPSVSISVDDILG
jgi:Uma2 family endonuclease